MPHAASIRRLFFQRDAEGRSRSDRWLADPTWKLKTDERVLVAAKARTRPALLEVQAVGRDGRLRMRDLLRPDAPDRDFVDRRLAGSVGRYGRLLGWVYSLPHFDRLSGTAIIWGDLSGADFGPVEILLAISAHLGGPAEAGEALTRWIEENFERVDDALRAVQAVRRHDMASGGDFKIVRHDYGSGTDEDLLRDLCATGHLRPDEVASDERVAGYREAWGWAVQRETEAGPVGGAEPMLGRVLRRPGGWRLAGVGVGHLAELRTRFEAVAGGRATWQGELVENIGRQMAPTPTDEELRLAPPRLREQPMRADFSMSRLKVSGDIGAAEAREAYRKSHWRRWPDESLPALGGRTPREAVKDPAARARVIELVKGLIRRLDDDNLRDGTALDINPLVRELGLAELDVPPPPPRPRPAPTNASDGDDFDPEDDDDLDAADFEDAEWRVGCSRMTAPDRRTQAQILGDLQAVVAESRDPDELVRQVELEVPELLDWVVDEAGSSLGDDALDLLEAEVAALWCALTPVAWADDVGFDIMPLELEFKRRREKLDRYLDQPGALDDMDALVATMVGEHRNRRLKIRLWSLAMTRLGGRSEGQLIGRDYALVMGVLLDELLPAELPEA